MWGSKKKVLTIADTEDYVLVTATDVDKYYIVNKVTHNLEHEEPKLPTALYQLESMQKALSKFRDEKAE